MSVVISGANAMGSAAVLAAMSAGTGSQVSSCEGGAAFVSSPDCFPAFLPPGAHRGASAFFASSPAGMACSGGPGRKGKPEEEKGSGTETTDTAQGAADQLTFALLHPGAKPDLAGVAAYLSQPGVTTDETLQFIASVQEQAVFHAHARGRVEELARTLLVLSLSSVSGTVSGVHERIRTEVVPELCEILARDSSLAALVADTLVGQCPTSTHVREGVLRAVVSMTEGVTPKTLIPFFDTLLLRAAHGTKGNGAAALLMTVKQANNGFYRRSYPMLVKECAERALAHDDPKVVRFARRVLKDEVMPGFVSEILRSPWMRPYRHHG